MTATELEAFLADHFPQVGDVGFRIEKIEENFAQVRMIYHDSHLRPGGTISGPSLMLLADTAMYMAVLGMIGPVALAVTTSLNINFLRKPKPADVIAQASLLKGGRRGEDVLAGRRRPRSARYADIFDPSVLPDVIKSATQIHSNN
jgi:uncharacterized protein (TIGR00369 family)